MPKTKTETADEMRMKQSEFDDIMSKALGAGPQRKEEAKEDDSSKRLSAYPRKKGG